MQIIADLHLHSKYSRAVSQQMNLEEIARWAKLKGIHLVATGDWTHPLWFREIKSRLKNSSSGIYQLNDVGFILSTEISSIYSQGDKLRRIHSIIISPSLETCEKINKELAKRGGNLLADGRPIIGLSAKELLRLVLEIDEKVLFIPAHAWTPWFSLYGSKSGFDSLFECFGELDKYIYAIETGLSCYDEKTEVLTENGWKKFTKITYKDKMCTLNPLTEKIEYQRPTKIHCYQYKGKMYRLKTKRADLLVTPNHKLLYGHCDFRKKPIFVLKEAEYLFNKSKRLKKDGVWIGQNPKDFILPEVKIKHGSRFYSGFRVKKTKFIPIKPWLRFFGFWMAEGWVTEGKDGDYNICVCNNKKSFLNEMKRLLENIGYKVYQRDNLVRVRDYQLFSYLKQFGTCGNKFIPREVKTLSKELLEIFFEYYIKGDGHIYGRNKKGLSATTTSQQLRDDLQEIALKMGISAYYKLHNPKGTLFRSPGYKYKKIYRQRNDSWTIFFIRKNIHTVLPSLIKRGAYTEKWIDFEGPVYCVTVPNHTLYIRRNSIPLWCGNSDPIMNWQIEELKNRSIVSFSDAHSGPKLGREATVFMPIIQQFNKTIKDFTYDDFADAIKQTTNSKLKIGYTTEFFPEEGKYHWTGHRSCNIKYSASETKNKGIVCPVCRKPLTIGVENRVLKLSKNSLTNRDLLFVKNQAGLTFVYDKEKLRRPFVSLVPLLEVLTEINDGSPTKAQNEYERLTSTFATEFDILMKKPYQEIEKAGGERLKQAIEIIRERKVFVDPGYDGVFGKVKIFQEKNGKNQKLETQQTLF